jgi:hypothetical protein
MNFSESFFKTIAVALIAGPLFASTVFAQASCKVNDPNISTSYTGGCKDGLAEGKGEGRSRDVFVGEFRAGNKHKGTYTWFNGNRYEGEYNDDKQHGMGTLTLTDGRRYVGEWKDDKINGKGTHSWPESNRSCGTPYCSKKYVGNWENGKRTCGVEEFWNGDSYDGCLNANGAMIGKTKSESRGYERRSRCEHLYIGKAVDIETTGGDRMMSWSGTVLGFSPKHGKATVRITSGIRGDKEIDCAIIYE